MQKISLRISVALLLTVAMVATAAWFWSGPSRAQEVTPSDLDTLPISNSWAPQKYDRTYFGESWTDDVNVSMGHNGCDTRNDILRRDLVNVELKPNTNGCAVLRGTLNDKYTGSQVAFQRGSETSGEVQIDHIVSLSDAWRAGAWNWDAATRRNFANDPDNLMATTKSVNYAKGRYNAGEWMPSNAAFHCEYAQKQVSVKKKYGLSVTNAEQNALRSALSSCRS